MKLMATVIGCLAALAIVAVVSASETTKAIVGSYLQVQAALAADKMDGVKPAARAIGEQAARMGASGTPIAKAAKEVEEAADIKAARTAFGNLSDAVIEAAKADGWKDLPEVKLAYCPMVKKYWLQKEATISNPYYGASMLTCGEFKER